jgi:hypothetical protein
MARGIASILAALLLGLGIAAAGYFVSQTMLNQRIGANTASVKGLSERVVKADTATWRLGFSVESRDFANVAAVFDTAQSQADRVRKILADKGFTDAEVYISPLQKSDEARYNSNGDLTDRFYRVSAQVTVTTQDPAKVEPARAPLLALAREGIAIHEFDLAYRFTKLNDIKPDMLREATENARIAANEFASDAGVKVGGIQYASQGGFQIKSATDEGPGLDQIDKLVRVVTTITFYLAN